MERGIFMPVSTTEKILSEDYFDLIVPITGSDTDFEEAFFPIRGTGGCSRIRYHSH